MAETSSERKNWLNPVGPKQAARRARRYFPARDKHVAYGYFEWQVPPVTKPAPAELFEPGLFGKPSRLRPIEIRSARSTTDEYVAAVNKLIEFLELPPGWNSYSASPIRKENVTFAVGLLAQLMRSTTPAPHVIPKVRGGLQLEWHMRGIDIEISIESPDKVNFFAQEHGGAQEAEDEQLDEQALRTWVDRLSE